MLLLASTGSTTVSGFSSAVWLLLTIVGSKYNDVEGGFGFVKRRRLGDSDDDEDEDEDEDGGARGLSSASHSRSTRANYYLILSSYTAHLTLSQLQQSGIESTPISISQSLRKYYGYNRMDQLSHGRPVLALLHAERNAGLKSFTMPMCNSIMCYSIHLTI